MARLDAARAWPRDPDAEQDQHAAEHLQIPSGSFSSTQPNVAVAIASRKITSKQNVAGSVPSAIAAVILGRNSGRHDRCSASM